jgi:TolB-like protein/Flp pilus assembly protein TadD
MAETERSSAPMEIAHVLFIDIVGYSKLLMEDQQAAVRQVNQIARGTADYQAAEAGEKLVRIPTGDGMALVFFSTPEAPVRCAVEMSRALRGLRPAFAVRMGIHSGPVSRSHDTNAEGNIAGAGINLAQRVMDCGDGGHILLSERVAEDIGQTREWRPYVHDIGESIVKHGVKLHLVNLHGEDFGNSSLPSRMEAATTSQVRARRARVSWQVAVALLLVATLIAVAWFWRTRTNVRDKSIAVLPFENFSDDKANAFLADGLQDDILTSLARISDLRVISRTSTERYRGEKKSHNLPEIARAIGATNVLEGSVRREGNRMVVNVQLIDAVHDRHLWANRYDRSMADSLGLQGELARDIADALQATLTPDETASVEHKPTTNPEAYELYLQARNYEFKPDTFLQDYRTAEQLYLQAVTMDPKFALAHARLSMTRSRIYHYFEPTEAWGKSARSEAALALQLQSNLGEGHHALGLCYYWLDRDYAGALREFEIAEKLLPNDTSVPWHVAAIKRRRGQWQEAVADYHQILTRDPQNANVVRDLLYVLCSMRDWAGAERTAERLLALTPDSLNAKAQMGYVQYWAKGSPARLKSELATFPAGVDPDGAVTAYRIDASLIDRDVDAAERALQASPLQTFSYFNGVDTPRAFFAGEIALLRGDAAAARGYLEQARDLFAASVRESPDVADPHAFLGLACALLEEKERAIREGKRAVELVPESADALDGAVHNGILALIYARTGENAQALALLQHLLSIPGAVDSANYSITVTDLKLRWEWDPIRNDPAFAKLLAEAKP